MKRFMMCFATSILSWGAIEAQESTRPNIIFILADDLGYGDLGCYGQNMIQTPRLDQMAAEGIRFTQCYAGSTVCAPSRGVLMTGLHTGHARFRGNKGISLLPEDVTVAEVLREAGYRTALIGKWALGTEGSTGVPTRQGFDEFYGFNTNTEAHNYYPEFLWRNEAKEPLRNVEQSRNVSSERLDYAPDLFTREALEFIRRAKNDPFFLYLNYIVPHANNERFAAMGDGMEVPEYGIYAEKDWPVSQKGHAAMITRMDRDIGRVLDLLGELNLDEKTIVFFSSDNGPHKEGGAIPEFFDSNGPLRGIKRDLYEGGIRVPGIARWPGVVPAGVVSDQIFTFWDFLPTAAELASVQSPNGLDGISIAPTLTGKGTQRQHEYLYWEFHEGDFVQAVRQGDWKAVRSRAKAKTELFNLSADISETQDVSGSEPDRAGRLERVLDGARTPSSDWPIEPISPEV